MVNVLKFFVALWAHSFLLIYFQFGYGKLYMWEESLL